MEFKDNKPIYLQIVDLCFRKILKHEWKEEERIPSVRELSVSLEVNPNTVMRSYDYLQSEEIIYSKRGMGYFVKVRAYEHTLELQRKSFYETDLAEIFNTMTLLDISVDDVVKAYNNQQNKQLNKKV